jgi:uncharacterized membrane protein YjgN (DUF898 family)
MDDSQVPPPTAQATSGEAIYFSYVPKPGLGRLSIVNFLLGIVTLTIYRFWAKTEVRKHIWSCVHINGQPLEYTGRGSELFKGALIVFLVFGLPIVLAVTGLTLAYGPEHPAIAGIQGITFLAVAVLWGAAIFRARRYQLSRTLWRGIRGTLEGSAMTYSLLYFGRMLAKAVTLGWATPVMNLQLQENIISAMRFGDLPFKFRGRAGPLYPSYALCWFATIGAFIGAALLLGGLIGAYFGGDLAATFGDIFGEQQEPTEEQAQNIAILIAGIFALYLGFYAIYPAIWAFYSAREMATFAGYTSASEARFAMDVSAWEVIKLLFGNFFIAVLTLGIAMPFVSQRNVRFLCDRIKVSGTINVDAIRQSQARLDKTGEGLADAFDIGGF